MNTRVALLGSFPLSLLLTGCPLTDHYQLMSEDAGGPSAGADEAGAHPGGGRPSRAGAGGSGGTSGASAGAQTALAAGEAGETAISGGPNGGALEIAGAPAGGAAAGGAAAGGAAAGGADVGGGGALEVGGGGGSGTAGAASGAGGASGGTGVAGAGGAICTPMCMPMETCCTTGCANLTTDAANCGVCGNSCSAGRSCAASACKGGWVPMAAPPGMFVARSRAAVVAMDKQVFFWGGQDGNGVALDTGAIYNPIKNSWKYLPKDPGAPLARMLATAVYTGSSVIVFGGIDANGNTFRDGSIYDIVGNQWTALPSSNAVTRRSTPFGYWDGSRAFFWGGLNNAGAAVSNADRFDLSNWSISTATGDPGAILYPGIAFDGATMYLFGGLLANNRQDRIYSYSASSDTWMKLTNSGLTPRSGPFTIWDGTRLVSWGGRDDNGLRSDGSSLLGTKWTALSNFGAPSPRLLNLRRAGWGFQVSPGVIAVIGGQVSLTSSTPLTTTGASYNVATSSWTAIAQWPSGEAHDYGMGAWTGQEFVLWGGRDNNGVTNTGERWAP